MTNKSKISIRRGVIGIILLVSIISTTICLSVALWENLRQMKRGLLRHSETQAHLIGEYVVSPLVFEDKEGVLEVLSEIETLSDIAYIAVYDQQNALFANNIKSNIPFKPPETLDWQLDVPKGYFHLHNDITHNSEHLGTICLLGSLDRYTNHRNSEILAMFGILLFSVALSIILANLLQRAISKPIIQLSKSAQQISTSHDFTPFSFDTSIKEVQILHENFNEMLRQISLHIQQRDLVQNDLRESEEFNRVIINSSRDCIKLLDSDGNLQFMSEGGQKLLEIDNVNDVLSTCWIDFWKGKFNDLAKEAVNKAIKGEDGHFEGYCPTLKGTPKWWDVIVTPIFFKGGKVDKLLAVSRDITDRIESRRQLQESEEKYRLIAKNSIDCIWQMTTKLHFTYLSPSVQKLFGYTPEEMIGTPLWKYAKWREFAKMARLALRTIKDPQKYPEAMFESKFINSDGVEIPVEISGKIIRDRRGKICGVQGITRDITERKLAEAALRESEQRLTLAIKGGNLGTWDWRIESGDLIVNEIWARMIGYRRDELEPKLSSWEDNLHPDDKLKTMSILNDHFKNHKVEYSAQFRMKCKSGEYKWILARGEITERDKRGNPLRMIGIHADIHELKKAEEKLHAYSIDLERTVDERTSELRRTVNLMAGREVRMAELKQVVWKLKEQIIELGYEPVADDPLQKAKESLDE